MAQPYKGPRTQVNVVVPDVILTLVERDRRAFEVSSMSQYLADLVCHLLGSPRSAREFDRGEEQLRLSSMSMRGTPGRQDASERQAAGGREPVKLRIPDAVVELLDKKVTEGASSSRKSYLEGLICTAYGRADLAPDLVHHAEQMALPIVALARHTPLPEKGTHGHVQLTA
ncbi:hypothetical protein [Pseudonocardia spinosispora]|uniref:hypothetical protein n=1 Tax=Pseudonocardia spinosispora TaxID=103441 RepID=UPI00040021FC|nr:hypothetical protein [Pseudonocardia spinosispora]